MTCNSSGVTVMPAISLSHTESRAPQAKSSRALAATQPEQSHSFAHALKEGMNAHDLKESTSKSKDESKDASKSKKAAQQLGPKDEVTSVLTTPASTASANPITGKFGWAKMVPDAEPVDTNTVNPEITDSKNLNADSKTSPLTNATQVTLPEVASTEPGDTTQAANLPPAPISGAPGNKNSNPVLMAMLAQSRLGE